MFFAAVEDPTQQLLEMWASVLKLLKPIVFWMLMNWHN